MNYKKDIRLDIRHENELHPSEIGQLKRSGLHEFGKLEAWTAIGTNKQLAYSTHGAMRFFGKFPPPIATHLIDKYAANDSSIVIDPMGGSGTTALECLLKQKKCFSFDINPLMLKLQKVKTTHLDKTIIEKEFFRIEKNYTPLDFERNIHNFAGLKNPYHWFLPETANSLLGIKAEIDKIREEKVRDFFLIAFLSIVRRVSRATTQQGRLFLDIDTAIQDAFPLFSKKVSELKNATFELPTEKEIHISSNNLMNSDSTSQYAGLADLVILHPPYFNSYKYSSVTSLETYWMGLDHANIRKNEVREFFKVGKPENNEVFISDMSSALTNAMALLKRGGHLGLMIGDTIIRQEYIQVTRKLLEKSGIKKSKIKTVALRVPKYTEASWAASQRRNATSVGINLSDFIVVIQK